MTREFIITSTFDKRWEKLNLDDDDLQELQNYIMKNFIPGDTIQRTGGAIKLRWALAHKGKSGGIRIIYADIPHLSHTHMLLCYDKNEQDDLTDEQKKQVKKLIQTLKGE